MQTPWARVADIMFPSDKLRAGLCGKSPSAGHDLAVCAMLEVNV